MGRMQIFRISRVVGELGVITACLWESGFLGWLIGLPASSPGYIRAEPGSMTVLLVDLGGEAPQLAGLLQPLTTLLLAAGIYLICKITVMILFQKLEGSQR